jgi:hypothetical protein
VNCLWAKSLEQELARLSFDSVVTVQWVTDPKTFRSFWEVGFYERNDVPTEGIQEIRGIPFVFNQGAVSTRLAGMTLDKDANGYSVSGV